MRSRIFYLINRRMSLEEKNKVEISDRERKVLDIMRKIDYGEIRIVINNSQPVRVEEIKKSVQL